MGGRVPRRYPIVRWGKRKTPDICPVFVFCVCVQIIFVLLTPGASSVHGFAFDDLNRGVMRDLNVS